MADVIDVESAVTESADQVADRTRQVLEYVPAERLGLSTDCGMINLPRMISVGKLRAGRRSRDRPSRTAPPAELAEGAVWPLA